MNGDSFLQPQDRLEGIRLYLFKLMLKSNICGLFTLFWVL